jgi:G3E family GTPase
MISARLTYDGGHFSHRLHAALGGRSRPGALGRVLRLKGVMWLASRNEEQAIAALAGTQFSLSQGPPWCGTSECSLDDGSCALGGEHRARKTEIVCIGQELDHAAASKLLDGCLLTKAEMARGEANWSALPDPFPREEHHHHEHSH